MSKDREQYIKQLEDEVKNHRMSDALMGGIFWGGFMPPVVYEAVNQLIGRETGGESLLLCLAGAVAGPTIAFIREKRRQKREF